MGLIQSPLPRDPYLCQNFKIQNPSSPLFQILLSCIVLTSNPTAASILRSFFPSSFTCCSCRSRI